ncbi:MAG TPA: hypothetical protein P5091_05600, partial [Acholeplasmataceae bacterium]|nr:hypothetical protein [Acholeplasmataceae bacterium]
TLTLGTTANQLVAADLTSTTMTYDSLAIQSFSIQNTQNTGGAGSNAQIYILSIAITYDVVE